MVIMYVNQIERRDYLLIGQALEFLLWDCLSTVQWSALSSDCLTSLTNNQSYYNEHRNFLTSYKFVVKVKTGPGIEAESQSHPIWFCQIRWCFEELYVFIYMILQLRSDTSITDLWVIIVLAVVVYHRQVIIVPNRM